MDEDAPEEMVKGILNSLDIDSSGVVDFGEFCQIFGPRKKQEVWPENAP
jgi:Ca2+-binding EF-hand superfamily protein